MPHIVSPFVFKTKKAFKEAAEARPDEVYCDDPSIFPGSLSGSVSTILKSKDFFTVTNHPKRSWFAQVEMRNGKVKVT